MNIIKMNTINFIQRKNKMYYQGRVLLYPLNEILNARAKVTMKRRLRRCGIVQGINELSYHSLEIIFNLLNKGN